MGIYTTAQIRSAILDTAKLFEEKPGLYRFINARVPECGTPGCMVGHIAAHLGVERNPRKSVYDLQPELGFSYYELENLAGRNLEFAGYTVDACQAVKLLRAFADHRFPAEKLDTAYLAFRSTLSQTMEGA
jgi:hypothetical protein